MASTSQKTPRCPICERPSDAHYRPFCSKRCADVDLARWLSGSYAIPDDEDEDGGDTSTPAEPQDDVPVRRS
ncbi:MAG: DNA gyrase inhibitor YacG [Hyphomicrobiaceae bacterium]|nr:DNA gyrase inhibitor YacG [Hyphomicrobiaceae bacterium]